MIRHQAIDAVQPLDAEASDLEDGSMRIVEYVLAFVALVGAGILALAR
jgi:hypothetical protein